MAKKTYEEDGLTNRFWRDYIRPHVLLRDGFECVECGSTENLHVHSKSQQHLNLSDLITLCMSCHMKAHKKT